jgi:predicted RNA-binding Zn-ribbon protein involved in translation (DUF1610 family)
MRQRTSPLLLPHFERGSNKSVQRRPTSGKWISVHTRARVHHCGYVLRREEVDSRQVASGMFHCPKCGLDAPLNVEIRVATELDVGRSGLQGGGSSGQR